MSQCFRSERSLGNESTWLQEVSSHDHSECCVRQPGSCQDPRRWAELWQRRVPRAVRHAARSCAAAAASQPSRPSRHGKASEFPVDCEPPTSSVLVKKLLSCAAPDPTLQPVCHSHLVSARSSCCCLVSGAAPVPRQPPELFCQPEAALG